MTTLTRQRHQSARALTASAARWLEGWLSRRLTIGSLTIHWPNGAMSRLDSGRPGAAAVIRLRRWRGLRRLATGGAIGFAEAFVDGDWDSPDLASAIELAALNIMGRGADRRAWTPRRLIDRIAHRQNENSRSGSRRNIAAHYDLGNSFYAQWLDETMSYSAALFERPGQSLEHAQTNKCRRLLDRLDIREGDRLLEIGCGWGYLSRLAARERGARVTAITLSPAQREHAAAAVQREGLADRVQVALCDYRDVEGQFDHIVSVEMIEAVGEKYWPLFFRRLSDLVVPGGNIALQAITIDDRLFERYRRSVDFIQRHVFPGGLLPSMPRLRGQAAAAGLLWRDNADFGKHYAETLAAWRDRFETAWPQIARLGFDERFRRLWLFYLGYCEGGFRAGNIDVSHILLTRPA